MKRIILIVFSIMLLSGNLYGMSDEERDRFLYSRSFYDKYRNITYWAVVDLSINDYHYGSGDAEYLKIVIKDSPKAVRYTPVSEIQTHFMNEFKNHFGPFGFPFYDTRKGWEERLAKFQKEVVKGGSLADYIDQFKTWEEARRNSGSFPNLSLIFGSIYR
jgi:hypothetical protein